MKGILKYFIFVAVFVALSVFAVSCEKDDEPVTNTYGVINIGSDVSDYKILLRLDGKYDNAKNFCIANGINTIDYDIHVDPDDRRPFRDQVIYFYVDKANPYYSSIDGVLFNKEKTELICFPPSFYSLKTHRLIGYVVPKGVTKIRTSAFKKCKYLNKIDFSKTGKTEETRLKIEVDAISFCKELQTVVYPEYYKMGTNFIGCPYMEISSMQ